MTLHQRELIRIAFGVSTLILFWAGAPRWICGFGVTVTCVEYMVGAISAITLGKPRPGADDQ